MVRLFRGYAKKIENIRTLKGINISFGVKSNQEKLKPVVHISPPTWVFKISQTRNIIGTGCSGVIVF